MIFCIKIDNFLKNSINNKIIFKIQYMLEKFKKIVALDNPARLFYHKIRAIIANIVYGFPSKNMTIIWVTWTNWKTTTCNIIAKWLRASWKKVFMFSTVNIIIDNEEFQNDTKMTSPDAFELQRLLKIAKQKWCEIVVIETASHWIKMNRIWWIEYDIAVLTNITQDHLDLHRTMKDYVNTKLKLFQNLIWYNRKPWIKKTAIINKESKYSDLFLSETYDSVMTYWLNKWVNLLAKDITDDWFIKKFEVELAWPNIKVETKLKWDFNIYNILAAVWVFISLWIKNEQITEIIKDISWVPWRMEVVDNDEWFQIIVDYAHTTDALENVLETIKEFKNIARIITVFWATWDRDKTKRAPMWEVVSRLSDVVILTQDDDYSEKTENIIRDVLPWIERKQSEDFWVIPTRREAIQTAILMAQKNDVVLVAWKWDEHVLLTNDWPIKWHDKTVIKEILKWIDDNKIV